jgi:predicted site-specific integrase-resolvase
VKEVGSGISDNRHKLLKLLADPTMTVIVVEHKDRLTGFGFRYIETLLEQQSRRIEAINLADDEKKDLLEDMVSIIYSFCAHLYGLRRAKRKTERIVRQLEGNDNAPKE